MPDALAEAFKTLPTRKILTLDIERLPGLATVWDQRTRFIPVSQWTRLPSLLCVAAKWYGKRPVEFHAAWDDYDAMVQASWDLIDQADFLVTFNGKRFDFPHLQGAWLQAGLTPPTTVKHVDLFQVARSSFGFESKSLAHLCERLGISGKNWRYDPTVAQAAVDGDEAAQKRMRTYNANDVRITERVYEALRPWISTHPHPVVDHDKARCNACGSDRLERAGTYLAAVMEYAQYRCSDCGAIIRAGHVRRAARTRGVRSI